MSVILSEITLDEVIDFQYYIAVVMSVSLFNVNNNIMLLVPSKVHVALCRASVCELLASHTLPSYMPQVTYAILEYLRSQEIPCT